MAETAKTFRYGKAPKELELKGDKRVPESAEHIITFPGGSFSVCRTSDNRYWVHIYLEKEGLEDIEQSSKIGRFVGGRMGRLFPEGVEGVEIPDDCYHLAFLVETVKP